MSPGSAVPDPNEPPPIVRVPASAERARQSQRALHAALSQLLFELPFADLTVQRILDRAGVGRATFYAHFQDKDDLLLTSFTRMLAAMDARLAADPPARRRLLPVQEFFAHVAEASAALPSLAAAGKLPTLFELATLHFARALAPAVGDALDARCLAAALVELLRWWLGARDRPDAAAMDAKFHAFAAGFLAR